MKRSNIRIIGVPKQQEEEQGLGDLFEEMMSEKFPDWGKKKSYKHRESRTRWTQKDLPQDMS